MPDARFKRVDIICIFDFELNLGEAEARRIIDLTAKRSVDSRLAQRITESYDWIYYRQTWSLKHGPATDDSIPALPTFTRIGLAAPKQIDLLPGIPQGAMLSVSAELGIGTFFFWNSFVADEIDVLDLRSKFSEFLPDEYLSQVGEIAAHMGEIERLYPFIGVRTSSTDVDAFCEENAEFLGKIFSGGLDHEPPATLRGYIQKNISIRDYERFFVRWTDALAVYKDIDIDLYEPSVLRLVQVYETAILTRRAFRTYVSQSQLISPSFRFLPRFIAIDKQRDRLLKTTSLLVDSLPVQSDEAHDLIGRTTAAFRIEASQEEAKHNYSFLEGRFQFAKATGLGALAVLGFLLKNESGISARVRSIWHVIGSTVHR